MIHKSCITPDDLATLSENASVRLFAWWEVDYGDLVLDMESGEVYMAGDTGICACLAKEHYAACMPLLSTSQLIQYLDDHGLYRDPKTGITQADGMPAEHLLDWLWSRTKAHLEYSGSTATPAKKGPTLH